VSQVTTHVLDTALGRPAAGVPVILEGADGVVAQATTDADGRVGDLGPDHLAAGTYHLRFDTAAYAGSAGAATFFPEVVVTFAVDGDAHHHVPLLLSPFGYTTYRGS
jgi:5-hydroxyisourate hydrolase